MDLVQQLRSIHQALPPATPENVGLRESLANETRSLLFSLERPDNIIERVCFQLVETAVIRSAVQMGLLRELNKAGESSVEDLAKACSADVTLVGRMLRCLAAWGAVKQHSPTVYSPANTSRVFGDVRNEAAIEFCFDILSHGWLAMPSFLEQNKWGNPSSSSTHPLAKAFNKPEGAGLWDILMERPASLQAFNTYMSNFNEGHKEWYDLYPVHDRLEQGAEAEPSSVMMVDVGGGGGHQAINFKRHFPQLPGRYVVQDLSHGLPKDRDGEVEFMEHDFSTPQPIKGARFYYLRYVTHDWSQDYNVEICTKLREAMKPGYSRLLINEFVIPATGASRLSTAMDFNLMCSLGGGMERTLALHQEYLERAGLKITNVYSPGDGFSESVIEAEVA